MFRRCGRRARRRCGCRSARRPSARRPRRAGAAVRALCRRRIERVDRSTSRPLRSSRFVARKQKARARHYSGGLMANTCDDLDLEIEARQPVDANRGPVRIGGLRHSAAWRQTGGRRRRDLIRHQLEVELSPRAGRVALRVLRAGLVTDWPLPGSSAALPTRKGMPGMLPRELPYRS